MTSIPWALLTPLFANKTWISVFVSFQSGVFPSTLISLNVSDCPRHRVGLAGPSDLPSTGEV